MKRTIHVLLRITAVWAVLEIAIPALMTALQDKIMSGPPHG